MGDGYTKPPAKDPEQLLREAEEMQRKLREELAESRGDTYDPDVDRQFREIVNSVVVPSDPSTWPGPDRSRSGRQRMVELIDLAGADGLMAADLMAKLAEEGHTPSKATLYNWLKIEKELGSIVQPGGDKSPYISARFHRPDGGDS